MMLNCAACVELPFGLQVSRVRQLFCFKQSDPREFAVYGNAGLPLTVFLGYAKQAAAFIVRRSVALVGVVDLPRNITQVMELVIRFIHVDMVYRMLRPVAMHIQPRKSVGVIQMPEHPNGDVPYFAVASCPAANGDIGAGFSYPSKNTCVGAVMKKCAQLFCGKIGISHDAPLKLIGQRPARVDSACGSCHFNILED